MVQVQVQVQVQPLVSERPLSPMTREVPVTTTISRSSSSTGN